MDEQHKADLLQRLKSAHGHLGGVIRMAESDTYCIDVLQQIMAVQSALDRASAIVLENHLNTCLTAAIRGDDTSAGDRVRQEILDVFHAGSRSARGR